MLGNVAIIHVRIKDICWFLDGSIVQCEMNKTAILYKSWRIKQAYILVVPRIFSCLK